LTSDICYFHFQNTKEFVKDETLLACKELNSAKANRGTPPKMDEGDKLATHSPIANHMEVLPNLECLVNSPVHQITHDTAFASEFSTKVIKLFVYMFSLNILFSW
jgi:hypothetical protein